MHKALKQQTAVYIPVNILEQWNQLSIMSPNATVTDMIGWLVTEFGNTTEEVRKN